MYHVITALQHFDSFIFVLLVIQRAQH